MKKLIVLGLVLGIMLCGSLAFAGPRGWGRGMGPGNGWSGYGASNLNLSQEQAGKLQTMRENYLKEITPLQSQMIFLRSEMRLLWNAANLDRDKILAKQKEISGLQSQLDEKTIQYRLGYRTVLTPEQQTKLVAFGSGMGQGRGPGRMRGGRW